MPRRFLDQRLKLPLLRVADALDTHGSLLKASAALGLGQPALTRSLRELEEITGAALFERHPRGCGPPRRGSPSSASPAACWASCAGWRPSSTR